MLTSNALKNVNKLTLFFFFKCCHYVVNVPFVKKKKSIKLLTSLLADEMLKTGLKWFDSLSCVRPVHTKTNA